MLNLVISVLEQGLIFGLLSLGVYLTYKILDFPDLSVDGTIVLGGSITAALLVQQVNPFLVTLVAMIGGSLAGLITGLLHVKLKITNLLSGILVMIGLYSINLRIMGMPNIPLFQTKTIFTSLENKIYLLVIILIGIKVIFDLFLKTKVGMLLRTTGDNPKLVTSLGTSVGSMKILGLMISNAMVALSGSLLAQYQRFSDVNSGVGTIVVGLASVIIGQMLFARIENRFLKSTTIVVLGALVYKALQAITLQLGLNSSDFKLITSCLIILALGINHYKGVIKWKTMRFSKGKKGVMRYVRN